MMKEQLRENRKWKTSKRWSQTKIMTKKMFETHQFEFYRVKDL